MEILGGSLRARLEAVADAFECHHQDISITRSPAPMDMLMNLVQAASQYKSYSLSWLVYLAFLAQYPLEVEFRQFQRKIFLGDLPGAVMSLMQKNEYKYSSESRTVKILSDTVVLVMGQSKSCEELLASWLANYEAFPANWSKETHILSSMLDNNEIIIPYRSLVIHIGISITDFDSADRLVTMSKFINSPQSHLINECVLTASESSALFSLLKYSKRIGCSSETLADEFTAFLSALSSQGLAIPKVSEFSLPSSSSMIAEREFVNYSQRTWSFLVGDAT